MSFIRSGDLTAHKGIRVGQKPYTCAQCGTVVCRKRYFTQLKRTDAKDKPPKCNRCGKGFVYIASLKAHEETHTREESSISDQCGKSSEQTENGLSTAEKLVTCIQCAESFDRAEAFKKHGSTPCTEPLFKCEPSEKTFSISELLSCVKQENRE